MDTVPPARPGGGCHHTAQCGGNLAVDGLVLHKATNVTAHNVWLILRGPVSDLTRDGLTGGPPHASAPRLPSDNIGRYESLSLLSAWPSHGLIRSGARMAAHAPDLSKCCGITHCPSCSTRQARCHAVSRERSACGQSGLPLTEWHPVWSAPAYPRWECRYGHLRPPELASGSGRGQAGAARPTLALDYCPTRSLRPMHGAHAPIALPQPRLCTTC